MADDDDGSPRQFEEGEGADQFRDSEDVVGELEPVVGSEEIEFGESEVGGELAALDDAGVKLDEVGEAVSIGQLEILRNEQEGGVVEEETQIFEEINLVERKIEDDVKSAAIRNGTDVKSENVLVKQANGVWEQPEGSTAFDGSEWIDGCRNGVEEEHVWENVAGRIAMYGVVSADNQCMVELPVTVPDIVMGEQENMLVSASQSIFESEQFRFREDASMVEDTAPRNEDRRDHLVKEQVDDEVHSEWMNVQESESPREVADVDSAVQPKVENILFVTDHRENEARAETLDHTKELDNPGNDGGDEDEETITEEKHVEDNRRVKADLLAASGSNLSMQKVEFEPTASEEEVDEEFVDEEELSIADAENIEDKVPAPDANISLQNIELEPAGGEEEVEEEFVYGEKSENIENEERTKEDSLAAPDANISLQNVELEPAGGDEEVEKEFVIGEESENIEGEEKTKEDFLAAPDANISLQNVELESATGEEEVEEEFVYGEESENMEDEERTKEDFLAAPDANISLQNVELESATGEEEVEEEFVYGEESENIEDEERTKEDFLVASDATIPLQNVNMEPSTGEEEVDEEFVNEEELSIADAENAMHNDIAEAKESGNVTQGSGHKSAKVASSKKVEEDMCFVCFKGGDLVPCDRRGCPKVYHPSCINRQTNSLWNCGWHLCSKCEKNAQYMCFTCTFSLCKGCIKDTIFYSVRGNKGFCETCWTTVHLIQSEEKGSSEGQLDLDDKNCRAHLFKNYWLDLNRRLQLTSEEIDQAKNRLIGCNDVDSRGESVEEANKVNNKADTGSNNFSIVIAPTPKRQNSKKQTKSVVKGDDSPSGSDSSGNGNRRKKMKMTRQAKSPRKRGSSANDNAVGTATGSKWASNELLKFVMHMRNGNASVLSQFEVQELLLEYIKSNKLRDPRRKSQIICDAMLKGLFGKQRVAHFEMLKLLESHFLIESQSNDFYGTSVDDKSNPLDESKKTDASAKTGNDKKRKTREKGFGRGTQSNTEDYAAIDNHNISLVFLRRNLMEILLEDIETFHDKVVGAFVRIRITGTTQVQDMYRLVQIVSTTKAPASYKVGKRTTDINLEIQNLNKKEAVSIDIISNQEFSEDECKRLRQSIKCGLIPRLTVGDILQKAMDLQAARVSDWLETEMVRLSHLCDRASDMGRRKELKDNVQKLQNLKKPQERQRRLEEIPEVHSDPKMDPSYESEEEEEEADDRKQENFLRPRGSFTLQGKDTFSPQKGGSGTSWELGRSLSGNGLSNGREHTNLTREINRDTASRNKFDDHEPSTTQHLLKGPYISLSSGGNGNAYSTVSSESGVDLEYFQATPTSVSYQTTATINESDKIWHYKDPSGKIQGPFSFVQLRKWNSTGYFPADLVIWKIGEDEDDGILLVDALAGKFWKETKPKDNQLKLTHQWLAVNGSTASGSSPSRTSMFGRPSLSVDMNNVGARNSGYDVRNDLTNLPSPTPGQISAANAEGRAFVNRISSSSQSVASSKSLFADNIQLDRLPSISPAVNAYGATYNQQTISPGYHAPQPDISAASVNPRNFVGSSMMQSVTQQHFSQILGTALNPYSQWGNNATAVGAENPGGSFQNHGFSGMLASTTLRQPPSLSVTPQPVLQANMGWVAAPPNANVSWTTTPPQVNNPSWAVQGMVVSAGRVAQPESWSPSGNGTTPGYMAPGISQVGRFMNHGWTGPNGIETNEMTRNENSSRPWKQQRGESRSRVCEFYMNGRCNRGNSCNWVHPQRQ